MHGTAARMYPEQQLNPQDEHHTGHLLCSWPICCRCLYCTAMLAVLPGITGIKAAPHGHMALTKLPGITDVMMAEPHGHWYQRASGCWAVSGGPQLSNSDATSTQAPSRSSKVLFSRTTFTLMEPSRFRSGSGAFSFVVLLLVRRSLVACLLLYWNFATPLDGEVSSIEVIFSPVNA
eukprot:CAMPEP_0202900418 /NCGR_PEP_ID=MMETSP1392-20130828/11575_1 /ASSEMBLY_ACC=CAM_ASM_000868 /TAXON_ID=225041 /ORGANISM="Chlamydomonas chlamydogama, Strain SAG 11-48b" /LENGTH=176 /DNA_ID=CAMNT_0049586801 /DNA_START=314 /DNA_END=845 /DNA_ORIENTATION=-